MRRGPAGTLECLGGRTGPLPVVIARIPNVLPSRAPRWVLPLPYYPGYTPPLPPTAVPALIHARHPGQRLADSVKTVNTGSPTYRHATSDIRHATSDIRHATSDI